MTAAAVSATHVALLVVAALVVVDGLALLGLVAFRRWSARRRDAGEGDRDRTPQS